MFCKHCGADIEESLTVCPCCGGDLEDQLVIEEIEDVCYDEPVEEDVENNDTEVEEIITEKPVKKRKAWQIILAIFGCFVLLVTLSLIVLGSGGSSSESILDTLGITLWFKENNIVCKDSYTVADDRGEKIGDKVAAKIGNLELTNGELQVFYTLQIYEYTQYYGSVLPYLGLDTTQPLSEQTCYLDDTLTWEQYFIDVAIQTWKNYAVLNLLANEEGITLPQSELEELEAIPQELEQMAYMYGFENADNFVKENYGSNVDVDAYMNYMRVCYLGEYYYSVKNMQLMPVDTEIDAYFEAHQEEFASSGITKESGPIVDVRHILIKPLGEEDESGNLVYSDAAWANALKEAEELLNEWKIGEANENTFAALAAQHSDDTASASIGGLIQDITSESNYVEPFLKWSIDESREVGDTEIVKSNYGYHIMYFASGQPRWYAAACTQLLAERVDEVIASGAERWPIDVNYKAISICANEIVK